MDLPDGIPTRTTKRLRQCAQRDLLIGLSCTVLVTFSISFFQIDVFGFIYTFTSEHKESPLDAILVATGLFGLFAIVYAVRRWLDIKRLNAQITSLAYYDTTTHLPNRVYAHDRLGQMISHAKRHKGQLALLFIDFDRFKMVNDTYGHSNGDLLINSVGQRLLGLIRKEDTLARLGGDEFVIIVDLDKSVNEVHHLLHRLIEAQKQVHQIADWETFVSYSVGVSIYPKDGETTDELLVAADSAMYRAKERGKGNYQFYSENMGQAISERYLLEMGLKKAIEKHELSIEFQPLYDLRTRKVTSYEALLRWQFNDKFIAPELIIEIAEETHFISSLGEWILREAVSKAKQHLPSDIKIAVNVSAIQFKMSSFVPSICRILEEESFPLNLLILEITESALLQDFDEARQKIETLRSHGVTIAIDDFGTGYSSLGRLTELKVDSLKIDKGFIQKMHVSRSDHNIIKAIIALANELGLKTIAEGVETSEQLAVLESLDCDQLQGFYIGRPMTGQYIAERNLLPDSETSPY